jgi:hypothetical protein
LLIPSELSPYGRKFATEYHLRIKVRIERIYTTEYIS